MISGKTILKDKDGRLWLYLYARDGKLVCHSIDLKNPYPLDPGTLKIVPDFNEYCRKVLKAVTRRRPKARKK